MGKNRVFTVLWQDEEGDHRQHIAESFCKLGRSPDNDIVIHNRSVSRRHAVLLRTGDRWHIKDVGSQNGTRLNGRFVKEGRVSDGDEVQLGDVPLKFVLSVEGSSVNLGRRAPTVPSSLLAGAPEGSIVLNAAEISSGELSAFKETGFIRSDNFPEMLAALATVAQEMMQFASLDDLLERIIDLVFQYIPVEDAHLLLHEEQFNELIPKVTRTRAGGPAGGSISTQIAQRAFEARECILTLDAQEDPRFSEGMSIVSEGIRSVMCVPLWVRDKTCGILFVDSKTRTVPLLEHHLHFLSLLANVAAAAIQQVQLQRRVQQEAALKERLMRYQSPSLVDKLVSEASRKGMLEPTEREVTVLFADMVAFSTRIEQMVPRDVAQLLNGFFSTLVEVIFEYEGTLDKFIGDSVMAIFGAPHDQPDHARRAVRAAVDIKRRLDDLNRHLDLADPIDVRIGINTGVVLSGDIGSNRRMEYTVLGNAVNIAARFEAFVAQPGDIVLGEATLEALRGELEDLQVEPLGPQLLKGMQQPVEAFKLMEPVS